MKKFILSVIGGCMFIGAYAQQEAEPIFLPYYYSVKLSPNGKWMGSMAGGAAIYNIETGEILPYYESFLGLGNCITDDGVAVGEQNDVAKVMKDGRNSTPPTLRNSWFCDINAITRDGSRLTGIINNPNRSEVMYVPFYCDIDDSGNVGEPIVLPYPELDFFNAAPQFVTAVWISDDGNTIIGEVMDWRGMYEYPIIYTCENGDWSYTLPSEQYFNPEHIEIPENPWLNEPPYPEVTDFMSPESREFYEEEMAAAIMGEGDYPDPFDYLSAEEEEAYIDAVEKYNEWYYSVEERIKEYVEIYSSVTESSPMFNTNEMTLHPEGKWCAYSGGYEDGFSFNSKMFIFSGDNWEMSLMDMPLGNLYPSQILPDGTMIACTPMMDLPTTYILFPDSEEFISIEDYFAATHPLYYQWMNENLQIGSGLVSVNDDMTVFSGGILFAHIIGNDDDTAYYNTYIFTGNESGVETVNVETADGLYTVFNLHGQKVLETRRKSDLEQLSGGIYIINGKKVKK